ncbi:MAG: hypothetical protein ACT6FF_03885 [Methanosarcinaceae archaeon]
MDEINGIKDGHNHPLIHPIRYASKIYIEKSIALSNDTCKRAGYGCA